MELRHLDDIQLQNYLEMADSLSHELKKHLDNCEQCQAELHHYQKLTENITAANQPILSALFTDKVMTKIKNEGLSIQPVEDNSMIHILLAAAMSLAGVVVALYFFFGFDLIITQSKEFYYNAINIEQWQLIIFIKAQFSKFGTTGEILLAAGFIILLFAILDNYLTKAKPGKASFLSI